MATVLVFGSHPHVLGYVTRRLEEAGYDVVGTLDRDATLATIADRRVDALVIGGPSAHASREEVVAALHEREPWAPVLDARSPEDVVRDIDRYFTADAS